MAEFFNPRPTILPGLPGGPPLSPAEPVRPGVAMLKAAMLASVSHRALAA